MEQKKKKSNSNEMQIKYIKKRDIKDVIIGIFFLLFGLVFFVTINFWLIVSKINPPSEEIIKKFPKIIQFFIYDKIYGIIMIVSVPTFLIIFFFKKMALYLFRYNS